MDLKLKLIPILQHMHHNAGLASSGLASSGLVSSGLASSGLASSGLASSSLASSSLASSSREVLQQLVTSYPLVIVTLHTFTQLAASSLIDIPKRVAIATDTRGKLWCVADV